MYVCVYACICGYSFIYYIYTVMGNGPHSPSYPDMRHLHLTHSSDYGCNSKSIIYF